MVLRMTVPPRNGAGRTPRVTGGRLLALVLAAWVGEAAISSARAQQPPDKVRQQDQKTTKSKSMTEGLLATRGNPNAKMLVQADELVYDYQNDRVSAVGRVQIYYDGAILEADKVTHDRKTNRLFANGNVRYKTKDGRIIHGDTMELDQDFRDGFVDTFLLETPEKTRFAAKRAERSEGNITVFQSGVYTACEPCKNDPTRPPLWQIKATRIVHNEGEKVVYHEQATLEFLGVPIAYMPYFWHPDPTVKRQSGFLAPHFFSTSKLGIGVEIPYFWNMAPNYDLTFSVTPLSKQIGPLVKTEWRHRLPTGAYTVRTTGVFQQEPKAFSGTPGDNDFRGAIESSGQFHINKKWTWGWDATLVSDRTFFHDYSLKQPNDSEAVNQLYLTGQGDRSYFDLRGMGFIGFSQRDRQDQLPWIHPILDYSYILGQPVMGGELGFRMNFTSLSREQAEFSPTSTAALGSNACDITKIGFNPAAANCFLRGAPGDYTRMSAEMNWKRTLTTAWGIVVKPFASARLDTASVGTDNNFGVASYADAGRNNLVRGMATVGVETRWPFISVHSWGTQVVEPIAQFIIRPNENGIGRFPNEDAQSLVFDDTNLFAIDKYSGYDRVEGGSRLNLGVQYTANVHRYGMINVLFGQSYNLFGRNSFAFSGSTDPLTGQQTGLGLQSGLETDTSDYVGRVYFQPTGNLSFTSRFRWDKEQFALRRFEFETRSTWDRLTLSTIYARYEAQPLIGFLNRREGIYQTASLKLTDNWSVSGGIRYDLDSKKTDLGVISLAYIDECFATSFSYIADYTSLVTTRPVHKFLLRLNLRTIGGTGFSTHFGSDTTNP